MPVSVKTVSRGARGAAAEAAVRRRRRERMDFEMADIVARI
jgi:hypothetical protein